jgi:hypothetical protein
VENFDQKQVNTKHNLQSLIKGNKSDNWYRNIHNFWNYDLFGFTSKSRAILWEMLIVEVLQKLKKGR